MEITVKSGEENFVFNNINPTLSIVDTGVNNYVISDDKNAIASEIEAFATNSRKTLESVPYHKKVVAACEKMQYELNPSLQKEVERDKEMNALRSEVATLKESIGELTSLLKSGAGTKRKE